MNTPSRTVVVFTVPLLLLGVGFFVVVRAARDTQPMPIGEPAPLRVTWLAGEIPLEPTDPFWTARDADSIRLYPQAALPPFGTHERDLWVRAAYSDREIAFHLEFADATHDPADTAATDACAVLLTLDRASAPSQIMGHGTASNVWHWQAISTGGPAPDSAPGVRELFASGPGTQMPVAAQHVHGRAAYHEGRWRVTFRRARAAVQPDELALHPEPGVRVSFALWDGARREALSRKSIAELRPLRFSAPEDR